MQDKYETFLRHALKSLRRRNGLTLDALSKKSGVGKSTIGNFETGKTSMSEEKLKTLFQKLGMQALPVESHSDEPSQSAAIAVKPKQAAVQIAEVSPDVDTTGLQYGERPPEYDVRWKPGWNRRGAAMHREDLVDLIASCIPKLYTRPPGEDLARTCHFCMDLLDEIANRRKKGK